MKKVLDRILKDMTAVQISMIILCICLVIIIRVVCGVLLTRQSFKPDQLAYNYTNEEIGYVSDWGGAGLFSYGPYTNLDKGNYKLVIEYETDQDASFDVVYNNNTAQLLQMMSGTLDHNKTKMTKVFYSAQKIENHSLEIRTNYPGEGALRIKGIKIRRCFVFKWYILVTIATIALSIILFRRREILTIFKRPKEILYFASFYTLLIVLAVYSMAYVKEQGKSLPYIVANILVVLHAYGAKKEIYRTLTRGTVSVFITYVYLIGSFYALDLILRYTTTEETEMTYADSVPNLFSFCIIATFVVLLSLIPKLWIKRLIYGLFYYFFLILMIVQNVYYRVFGKLFSFKDMKLAKEGSDYGDYIMSLMNAEFIKMALLLILAGVIGILLVNGAVRLFKAWYLVTGSVLVSVMLYNHTIYDGEYGEWNAFENANYIYSTMNNRLGVFELCGFYQYELKDIKKSMFGSGGSQKQLLAEADDYFNNREEQGDIEKENEMTALLQGKNVIFILMESIDDIACDEQIMPNLYRMSQEGIYFSNMYAPIYGAAATMNTELVTNVGNYAPLDGSLVYSFSDNDFVYSLANRFSEQGFASRQYHFNKSSFYNRNFMNEAFGYLEYVSYMDYEKSDYLRDSILVERDDLYHTLIQDQKFFDYIITYSAHLSYSASDPIVQYALNKYPQFNGMTDSEEINNYFAKARITDDMLGGLIDRLGQDGLLEDTVIIAVGDHYPYGIMDEESLFDLSEVEAYEQLLCKVPCVIWTPNMEAIDVDKTVSTIDLVPTIVNLTGLGDTSMYVGHDIFNEDYEGLVYFPDGSWLTNDCYYHNGSLIYGTMSESEIQKKNKLVMDMISANDAILQSDYFRNKKD